MNKTDIAKALRNDGVKDAAVTLDKLISVITLALACGEEIVIRNFGKLEPRTHPASTGRNPRTGASVALPERQSVAFVPSRVLKARMNRPSRKS